MNYREILDFHKLKIKSLYNYDNSDTYLISSDIYNIICKYQELFKYAEDKISKDNINIKKVAKNINKVFRRLNTLYCENKNIIDNMATIATITNISYL